MKLVYCVAKIAGQQHSYTDTMSNNHKILALVHIKRSPQRVEKRGYPIKYVRCTFAMRKSVIKCSETVAIAFGLQDANGVL